jgi:hypothetical protein
MRLLKTDLDKRLDIQLDRTIKVDNVNGIMLFGTRNDYPQIMERLVLGSKTAKSSSMIYANFLRGHGFESEVINKIVIGKDFKGKNITIFDLLKQVTNSLSINQGVYCHLDINLNREVVGVRHLPFKNCRFSKEDDIGFCSKVLYYENWEKEIYKNKRENYNIQNIKIYNSFNLNKEVFAAQIKESGGLDKVTGKPKAFKGQVYFMFFNNDFLYPLSTYDTAYLDLDTENQVSIYKNNVARNGMVTDKTVIRVGEFDNDNERDEFQEKIKQMLGTEGDQVIILTDEIDPNTGEIKATGGFKIDQVNSSVKPDIFQNWTKELANDIRKTVNGLPAVLIDYEETKLGTTSGEAIIQATNFFNAMTNDERKLISQMFEEIFSNSINPELKNNTNWNIKPIQLYNSDVTNVQPATVNKTNIGK